MGSRQSKPVEEASMLPVVISEQVLQPATAVGDPFDHFKATGETQGQDSNNNDLNHHRAKSLKSESDRNSDHSTVVVEESRQTDSPIDQYRPRNIMSTDQTNGMKPLRMDSSKRESDSTVLVFLLEAVLLVAVCLFASFIRFSTAFHVVQRAFKCETDLVSPRELEITTYYSHDSLLFHGIRDFDLYVIVLLVPVLFIFITEVLRYLILTYFTDEHREMIVMSRIGLKLSYSVRRMVRIIGGFLLGFACTGILIDLIKVQTGFIRPDFALTCPPVVDQCRSNPAGLLDVNATCHEFDTRDGQMDFPSITSGFSTYVGAFLILYTAFVFSFRPFRVLRVFLATTVATLSLLLSISKYTSFRNSLSAVIVGMLIGLAIALYIVFLQLNAFANRLSDSNFFSAKRVTSQTVSTVGGGGQSKPDWFWRDFHIPRVQHIRSSAQQPNSRLSQRSQRAYINPAFDGHQHDFLDNQLHREMQSTSRNSGAKKAMKSFPKQNP